MDEGESGTTMASASIFATSSYDEFREKQLDEEREFLKAKILENGGSVSLTAERLGMLRTALYNRLTRLGVNVKGLK